VREIYSAIDCFSGCGGLSQGLRKVGFRIIAGVEINPNARNTHELNHPGTKLYSDIRQVDPAKLMGELKLEKGQLDLLAGCPPCQGFSTMRTLNGSERVKDPRNKLIFDLVRLAVALKPKMILIENVPALIKDRRLTEAKRRLQKAGYKWILTDIYNAADFGVPQRRRRMILMASCLGPIDLLEVSKTKKVTVKHVIGRLPKPEESKNRLHRLYMRHSDEVMHRIRRIPKDGGSRSALGKDQLPCHQKLNGFRDVYGRMKWDEVAPTITRFCHNPSKGRFLHPEADRGITVYEAMLLQSFPRTYKFPEDMSMTEIVSLIGEALSPIFAEAQARHVVEHLRLYT